MALRFPLLLVVITFAAPVTAVDLLEVYEQALQADPRINIAELEVEIGREQFNAARGQLRPQVSATANVSDNKVDFRELDIDNQNYNGERYSLVLRQTLFNWQQLSQRAQARETIEQREAELLDTMAAMMVDVSERYFEVLLAQEELSLVMTELELAVQQQAAVSKQFERSLVPITQVYETRARADTIRADEIQARADLALAQEELALLTGTSFGALAALDEATVFPGVSGSLDKLTEEALAGNHGIRAREKAVLVALKAIDETKGGHMPQVDLVFSQQRSDIGFDNQQTPERDTRYIGIDVTVPLYSGGSTSAGVREAWHRKGIAEQELEAARREVIKATRDAYLNSRASYLRIEATARAKESAEKAYDAMVKSFQYGTVTSVDVLEALHRQTQGQRDYQRARFEYVTHYLNLRRQTGSVTVDDLVEVNGWLTE